MKVVFAAPPGYALAPGESDGMSLLLGDDEAVPSYDDVEKFDRDQARDQLGRWTTRYGAAAYPAGVGAIIGAGVAATKPWALRGKGVKGFAAAVGAGALAGAAAGLGFQAAVRSSNRPSGETEHVGDRLSGREVREALMRANLDHNQERGVVVGENRRVTNDTFGDDQSVMMLDPAQLTADASYTAHNHPGKDRPLNPPSDNDIRMALAGGARMRVYATSGSMFRIRPLVKMDLTQAHSVAEFMNREFTKVVDESIRKQVMAYVDIPQSKRPILDSSEVHQKALAAGEVVMHGLLTGFSDGGMLRYVHRLTPEARQQIVDHQRLFDEKRDLGKRGAIEFISDHKIPALIGKADEDDELEIQKVWDESKHPRDEDGRWRAIGAGVATAALAGAGYVGGKYIARNLKASHLRDAAAAATSTARAISAKIPPSTTREKIGAIAGLSLAGHLADYLTRRATVEPGVDLSHDEAHAASKDAHVAAMTEGRPGSDAYRARYDLEIARLIAHARAAESGPVGSSSYNGVFHHEFERLNPYYVGTGEKIGRVITGVPGAVVGATVGGATGAAAGTVGGAVAGQLASGLLNYPVSGALTGFVGGTLAGGYKGAQVGYEATAPVGGVVGRGFDRLTKIDGVRPPPPRGARRPWDESKYRRNRGKFTSKDGSTSPAHMKAPSHAVASNGTERQQPTDWKAINDRARTVGSFTGAAGSTAGGFVGALLGLPSAGVLSFATGLAGSIAGDMALRTAGERAARAYLTGDLLELGRETDDDQGLGEALGGMAGGLAGFHVGAKFFGAKGAAVSAIAGGVAGLAGELTGQATLADPIERALGIQKSDDGEWSITAEIAKIDDDKRMVYGWASVVEDGGKTVTDRQGDEMDADELVKAAHDFMQNARVAGEMHKKLGVGHAVESVVFTHDLQKALGINLGKVGWFVGMKINDDDVWQRVKKGELTCFSIGGRGVRRPIDTEAELKQAAGVAA